MAAAAAGDTCYSTAGSGYPSVLPLPCPTAETCLKPVPGDDEGAIKKGAAGAAAPCIETFLSRSRPDFAAMLEAVAEQCGGGHMARELRVGVFVAGPAAMVAAVSEACASLNGPWGRRGRAFLHLRAMTHEL